MSIGRWIKRVIVLFLMIFIGGFAGYYAWEKYTGSASYMIKSGKIKFASPSPERR